MSFGLKTSFGRRCRKTFEEFCEEERKKDVVEERETKHYFITTFKDGSRSIVNKRCIAISTKVTA